MSITATYVDANTFTVEDDRTAEFHVGRRVRCDCGADGYKYGTISATAYVSVTTVDLTAASDNLTANLLTVQYGIVGKGDDQSMPVHNHDGAEGSGGEIDESGVDHGSLTGLGDDDHSIYHNDARGDARYYTETELNAGQLDNRYFTESELNAGQLDTRYYTETEVGTWRASVTQTEMDYLHGVTSDIQTQLNAAGGYAPPGQLERPKFAYSSTTAIVVNPGAYMLADIWRYWDAALTFTFGSAGSNAGSDDLAVSDWFYLYLDASTILTDIVLIASDFIGSITEPTWSDAEHGWYNGSDRCVFAVLTNGASEILKFFHNEKYILYGNCIEDLASTDIDTTWVDVTLTLPIFATLCWCTFEGTHIGGSAIFKWRTNGFTGTDAHRLGWLKAASEAGTVSMMVVVDSAQKIEIASSADNDSKMKANTDGWFLPVGM